MKFLVIPLFVFFSLTTVSAAVKATPPNIIVIVVDNVNADLIGAYGNQHVKTPSIDQLARQGIRFDNAFANSGVCSPTRATLLTGLIPSQTGVHNALPTQFKIDDWSAVEEFRTLPKTLADAGYTTALIGKYHLGQPEKPQLGFDYWLTFPSGHTSQFHNMEVIDNGKSYRVKEHITDFWTQKAIEFITQQKSADAKRQPFFLYLAYNGPYMLPPLVIEQAQNRHRQYYEKNLPPMPRDPIHPWLKNFVVEAMSDKNSGGIFLKGWNVEQEKPHRWSEVGWAMIESLNNPTAMVHAVSEITMVDDGIGKILEALKKQGFDSNTLIVFTSDQGASLGQHGLWGNSSASTPTTAFDNNMKIPLIIRHTDSIDNNQRSAIMINQFDLMPTILDYAGLGDKTIENTPGNSFAKALNGTIENWGNDIFFDYIITRAIRNPQWKLIKRLDEFPDEFYDLSNDPKEYKNLINNPAYQEMIAAMNQRLENFFNTYANPQYDIWKGGTAKATLMYGGRNQLFESRFKDWRAPFVKKAKPFE